MPHQSGEECVSQPQLQRITCEGLPTLCPSSVCRLVSSQESAFSEVIFQRRAPIVERRGHATRGYKGYLVTSLPGSDVSRFL